MLIRNSYPDLRKPGACRFAMQGSVLRMEAASFLHARGRVGWLPVAHGRSSAKPQQRRLRVSLSEVSEETRRGITCSCFPGRHVRACTQAAEAQQESEPASKPPGLSPGDRVAGKVVRAGPKGAQVELLTEPGVTG